MNPIKIKATRTCEFEEYVKTGKTITRVFGSTGQFTSTHKESVKSTVIRQGEVELTIDLPRLFHRMAWNALYAKGKKSTAFHGMIRARVVRIASEDRKTETPRALEAGETYS